jgi:S1-C subfamily serine protease
MKAILAVIALAIFTARTADTSQRATVPSKEVLLVQSGFKLVTVTTPKQKEAVNGLAQGRCSAVQYNGKLFYVFPAATKDAIYVGKQAQFNAYKKAVQAQGSRGIATVEQPPPRTKPVQPAKPQKAGSSGKVIAESRPQSSGSGFFVTEDGYFITNAHVVGDSTQVRVVTASGTIPAKVVRVDAANDLALLKAEGTFPALPVTTSRSIHLGDTVMTVGFPNIDLQGFAPKFARGEIGSLAGLRDDPRFFQISVPVQPGNSGGALVDTHGNAVGVVSGKLSAKATLLRSGSLPENVNYAVKSSFLLGFLESVPEVKLPSPNTTDTKSDDVVERAQKAAALVLVYQAR